MRSRLLPTALLGALTLTLASCAGAVAGQVAPASREDSAATSDQTTGEGHGAVAGAAEVSEPPLGLTSLDPAGAVTHLDLLDESTTRVGEIAPSTAMTTDGRYLFAQTADGIEVIDSGVWTWDHVDHFHYYRADPRILGTVRGEGDAIVATTNLSTTGGTGLFFAGSGDAVLLSTAALAKGEIVERFRLPREPHPGMVVPVGSFALVTSAENGGTASVVGYTSGGEPTGLEEPCTDASGTITTRVGAVIGCADAALVASVEGDELAIERVPYPADTTAAPATAFANREGRPTVAALAGPEGVDGIWLLDTRASAWSLLPAPAPLQSVTAVDDDDDHVLALTTDGRVLVLDGTGAVLAETAPIVAESIAAGFTPSLIADQQRAYLNAPAERLLYEIDFTDGARIARSFETETIPAFTAETGR